MCKLFRYFISEADIPSAALVEPLAQQLRESDYDVGLIVRRMLASKLFFSETAYRRRIKSPVEYVVGMLRGLRRKTPMQKLVSLLEGWGKTSSCRRMSKAGMAAKPGSTRPR